MQLKRILPILIIGVSSLFLAGCSLENSTSNEQESVEAQQNVFVKNQPAPVFDWSLERHLLTQLYKARNEAVNTHSIVRDMNGRIYFECDSIGYPIPSNTQLTNPERISHGLGIVDSGSGNVTLPQPEPNGLYTSPSTAGTFVFCLNDDGTVSPSYFEANVEAHAQKLKINLKK